MTTQPCNWCDNDEVDPYDSYHNTGECHPIGLVVDDAVICLLCGQFSEGELVNKTAYPDGYTCADCGEIVGVD